MPGDSVKARASKFFSQFWRVSAFQILNSASAFFANILVARWIGPGAFGDFFVFVSTAVVSSILFDFGLSRTVLKYAAFHQARGESVSKLQYYYATLKLKLIGGLGALAVVAGLAWLGGGALRWEYILGMATGLLISFCQFLSSVAQTEDDYASYNWVLSFNLARLSLVAAAQGAGWLTLPVLYAIFVLSPLLMALRPGWKLVRDLVRAGRVPEDHFYRNLISFGKWMLLLAVLESLTQRLDVYGVRWLTSALQAGYYSGTVTFFGVVIMLPTYTAYLIYPRFVEAVSLNDRPMLSHHYRFSTDLNAALAIPLALGLWALAPELVPLFLGSSFAASVPLFKYLALATIFWSCQVNSGALFFAHDDPKRVAGIALAVLLILASALLVLTPRWGMEGAGAALALAMGAGLGLYWSVIRRRFNLSPHWGHLGVYCLVGGVMAAGVRLMPPGPGAWLAAKVILGAAVYGGLLLGLQAWLGWELLPWPKKKA